MLKEVDNYENIYNLNKTFGIIPFVRIFANKKLKQVNMNAEKQEQIARMAKAMAHPHRIAILLFLTEQDSCYFGDIHDELPIAKATVSQHLKELKDAGLIQGEIEAPKVKYCINRDNWEFANKLFGEFFGVIHPKKTCCE